MTIAPVTTSILFQPQVHVRTGDIYAFEAINLDPVHIDESVYLQYCLDTLTAWKARNITLPIAVNLSSKTLSADKTLVHIQDFCHAHPLPCPIVLHVVPTSLHQGIKLASLLSPFQALGIGIYLHDFGNGTACYDSLRQVSSDGVTLSHTLIEKVLYNTQDFTLVSHLIQLMRDLNKRLVVNHVSDLTLGKLLLQMGVEYIQGNAIAPPMPAEQALSWQQTWRIPNIWHAPDANPWPDEHQHLLKATVAHRQWLKRLEQVIDSRTFLMDNNDTQQFSHLRCELGRWMSNKGLHSYGHLDAFSKVDSLHQAFHNEADNLLLCASHHSATSDLAPLWDRTRSISHTLTEALLNLKNALYQD